MAAVEVESMVKRYGDLVAVGGLSLTVEHGEVFGILGRNGAGKTSTVECLEGLVRRDGGVVRVLGLDPQVDGPKLRRRIGVQLQRAMLPDRLKVYEAVELFAALYKVRPNGETLARLGLAGKRNAYFGKLSGGERQRLFAVLALLNTPELVFFDELSAGLDPEARNATWGIIDDLRRAGTTVMLTTHLMAEAERLCDRVAIIDRGQLVALDTPSALTRSLVSPTIVTFSTDWAAGSSGSQRAFLEALGRNPGVDAVDIQGADVRVTGRGDDLLGDVVLAAAREGLRVSNFHADQPTLEDAFLELTDSVHGRERS